MKMEYFLNSFSVIFQREVHNKEKILQMTNKIFDKFSIAQYYILNFFSNFIQNDRIEAEDNFLQDFVFIETKPFKSCVEMKKIN